ncbi:MAG: hypothetical protein IH978_09010, partial [Nitrospinae bacterium]|nr:hypothetical protein [Nitrospinota bacterium]
GDENLLATLDLGRVQVIAEVELHIPSIGAEEEIAVWESEEVGIVKWSGENGQRFSDA